VLSSRINDVHDSRYLPRANHRSGIPPESDLVFSHVGEESTGVVRVQIRVAARPPKYWQCPTLSGRVPTQIANLWADLAYGHCRALALLFIGDSSLLKEPFGADYFQGRAQKTSKKKAGRARIRTAKRI
jgi:hypothetical protein